MRFAFALLGAGLAQTGFSSAIASKDGKKAVYYGNCSAPLKLTRDFLARRGEEYNMDRLDELEEESEDASRDQVYKGIDYLVDIYDDQDIEYGLMGGIAMQLYGYDDRETTDSDMVVSVNSRDLLDKIKDDDNIARPSAMMAASGTARLFIKVDDQQVASDVFVKGGDQSPPLETQEMDGYNVLKIAPLINSKLRRAEEKDYADVLWLIQNKGDDVKDAADDIDKQKRIDFAKSYKEDGDDDDDDDDVKDILEAFKLSEEDIEDEDEEDDD